jgi:hypothetical protein
MLAQPFIAFAVFVASYPYLWPSPIRRTWDLYAFRAGEMADQSEAWPETAVASPLDALGRFGYYLTETHSTSRRFLQTLYDRFEIDRVASGYDFIPAIIGLVVLLWWVGRRGLWSPAAMVALLMGAEAGTLVIGMKTDFYRYHLPIMVIMAGCIGVGTGVGWSALVQMFRPQAPQPRPVRVPAAAARPASQSTSPVAGAPAYTSVQPREVPQ